MNRSTHLAVVLASALAALTACGGTSPPTSSGTPTPHAEPLTLYYIAVGDNGRAGPKIGCGDSVVATTTAPVSHATPVRSSMVALLANRSRMIGQSGLVNVLYQSTLTYRSATISNGTVTVRLAGAFRLGGVCDSPRAKAQLEYTAITAAHVHRAVIYIGDRTIDQALSLK